VTARPDTLAIACPAREECASACARDADIDDRTSFVAVVHRASIARTRSTKRHRARMGARLLKG
jgi:hypothetical protein